MELENVEMEMELEKMKIQKEKIEREVKMKIAVGMKKVELDLERVKMEMKKVEMEVELGRNGKSEAGDEDAQEAAEGIAALRHLPLLPEHLHLQLLLSVSTGLRPLPPGLREQRHVPRPLGTPGRRRTAHAGPAVPRLHVNGGAGLCAQEEDQSAELAAAREGRPAQMVYLTA